MKSKKYDVVVCGGGTAGIIAAIGAAKMGAKTLIVEKQHILGGELISGIPVLGWKNAIGEQIVGGIPEDLFEKHKRLGGFAECIFDWRLTWHYLFDPEILKIAIMDMLKEFGVELLIGSHIFDVVTEDNVIKGVLVIGGNGVEIFEGKIIIDSTGDGIIAKKSGAPYVHAGNEGKGEIQPISLVFRISNIDFSQLLEFIKNNPEELILAESPIIKISREACAHEIYKKGIPLLIVSAEGPLLKEAIKSGEMYLTMGIGIFPISIKRKEVSLNTTRVANLDPLDFSKISSAIPELFTQMKTCHTFLEKKIPGFKNTTISGITNKIGIRESGRIQGEYVLDEKDVLEGRRFSDVIAKGSQHIDIHGSGTSQIRKPILSGGSYDIPYRCLIPKKIENLFVVGRCASGTREGLASFRVMGTAMAMGQTAGIAAALCINNSVFPRDLSYYKLRTELDAQGAILDEVK